MRAVERPCIDRDVLDLDVLDAAADLGVTCTDHGRLTGDGDGLGNPSDGHADVDGETLTRGHDDRLADPIGESGQAYLQTVSPGVHRGKVVNPGGVGDDRDGESRVCVDQLHAGAGQDSSLLVGDLTSDAVALGERGGGNERRNQKEEC